MDDHPKLSVSRTIFVIISIHSMKRSIEIGTVHCETIIAKLDNYKKSKVRPKAPTASKLVDFFSFFLAALGSRIGTCSVFCHSFLVSTNVKWASECLRN